MQNNNNNNLTNKSFVKSFNDIYPNLLSRYQINMYLDFINECIKFADNTRDITLLHNIHEIVYKTYKEILNIIEEYETRD